MQVGAEHLEKLRALRGVVATVVTTGFVEEHFSAHFMEMRSWCDRNGFHNVEWLHVPAVLVESGRDSVVQHALQQSYDYFVQIDADAAPFPADTLLALLMGAYYRQPDAGVIGAYCQLKAPPYLPTIDTGTGTWQEMHPYQGMVRVIRTGGHCLLVKTDACRLFGPPWFRARMALRPVKALAELDNMARMKFGGQNPFAALPEWDVLFKEAVAASQEPESAVGEDSSFSDAMNAYGVPVYVDTDLVVGHVTKKVVTAHDLREEISKRKKQLDAACGVLT